MKEYIHALIRSQGENAAGKIAEDMKLFIQWIDDNYRIIPEIEGMDSCFEEFQDEVLNKDK